MSRAPPRGLGFPLGVWLESDDFFARVLHPDERALTLALLRAVAADGHERQCVHRVVSAKGAERWFRTRVRESAATNGHGRELLGVMLDVTERISADSRLQESEAHLRSMLDQLPALVWTTDRDLRFTSGVGRELASLGVPSSATLMGVSIQEYLFLSDPDDPILVKYRRALAGEPVSIESEWMGRAYQTHVEPFRDAHGDIVGVLAVSWNVTERKRAEDTLRMLAQASLTLAESLDYAESLRKVAHLAVGRLGDWCVVGVLEDDVLRAVASAHVDPSREPLVAGIRPARIDALGELGNAVRGRKSVVLAEVTDAMLQPGTELPLPPGDAGKRTAEALRRLGVRSLLVVPLVARDQLLGALVFGRERSSPSTPPPTRVAEDLARRCAMAIDSSLLYRSTQSAIDARDDFLSVASHELRTPLTSILLRLEAIERAEIEGRPMALSGPQGALTVVLRQAKRLSNLVEQLLDVSRIRRGFLDIDLEEADFVEIVRDASALLEAEAARTGSTLSVSAPATAVGRFDRARVEQVITNLLSNAIKFARGTAIEAEVEADDARVRLVVRDRGLGIRPVDQARIFERFERAASSQHFGGLGLGLYITRQIVLAHGGTIQLTSAPGEGTAVAVELPRSPPPAAQ